VAPVLAAPAWSKAKSLWKFTAPKSPSGLFFDQKHTRLMHVLCGTQTNNDHYIYVFSLGAQNSGPEKQECLITIPKAAGMSRVDGIHIHKNKAGQRVMLIADSQGPMHTGVAGTLGGSLYEVDFSTHPCGCKDVDPLVGGTAGASPCATASATWSPTLLRTWKLDAGAEDGAGWVSHWGICRAWF
jgi:hypothetical protein